jgi:hypothetical protein
MLRSFPRSEDPVYAPADGWAILAL